MVLPDLGDEDGRRAQVVDRPVAHGEALRERRGSHAALPDPVRLHVGEGEAEPGLGELGDGRHERDVELRSLLDPALGGEAVEVADELRLARGVAGQPHPGMPVPPLVLAQAPEEVAGDAAVHDGDGPARLLRLARPRDLGARVLERRQERLHGAMALVPLREQLGGGVDVGLLERPHLEH